MKIWTHAAVSVTGTRHLEQGLGCDDASLSHYFEEQDTLLLVASDGAGSSSKGALGAKYSVEAAKDKVHHLLQENQEWTQEKLYELARSVRQAIEQKLEQDPNDISTYAATLLLAILTPTQLACLQIGDGYIVVTSSKPEMFKVFSPMKGQYANQTSFVTSFDTFDELREQGHVQTCVVSVDDVSSIALITDGLESVCINLRAGSPHPPFFLQMTQQLVSSDSVVFSQRLEQFFLTSQRLNEKTDDDKTLVLAVNQLTLPDFDIHHYPVPEVVTSESPHSREAFLKPKVILLDNDLIQPHLQDIKDY